MPPIRIDDYKPEFARALVEMWRESFQHGVGIIDTRPIEQQQSFFENEVLPKCKVRVALEGAMIVGFIAFTPTWVEHLYVAVPSIGQGIGTRLLNEAKNESEGTLLLYTFAQNSAARAFYERHGFKDIGHGFENMWNLEDVKYQWLR
jgi:GNAT superfamily N-acetyltransferase